MPEYDTTELSRDPADYLNGPTGNATNRGNGGTTRDGKIATVQIDDSPRVQQTDLGEADTGGQGSGTATGTTGQQGGTGTA
jgi:hypothetical protein